MDMAFRGLSLNMLLFRISITLLSWVMRVIYGRSVLPMLPALFSNMG